MSRPKAVPALRPALFAMALLMLTPGAEAQFATGDLEGSWSLYTRFDDPLVNEEGHGKCRTSTGTHWLLERSWSWRP